jgi:hypothetical protein
MRTNIDGDDIYPDRQESTRFPVKNSMCLQKISLLNISLTRIQMLLIDIKIYGMNFT